MSTEIKKEVKCPGCGAMSQARMWSGINAEVNPNLRLSVLEESLFDWTCPHCGYQAMLAYPCLYHDKSRRFMIYILPGEPDPKKAAGISAQFPQLRGVRKRVTGSLATLKEKILLFEDGLDDRAAELVKLLLALVLANSTGKRVEQGFYCTCDEEKDRIGFSFFVEGEEEPVRRMTSFAAYRQALAIAESILPPDGDDFLLVNETFARALLYRYRHGGEMPEPAQPQAEQQAPAAPAPQTTPPEPEKEQETAPAAEPEPSEPEQPETPEQTETSPAETAQPADEAVPQSQPRTEQILGPAADPVAKPVAEWVAKPVAETIAEAIDEPEDTQETPVDFSILETPTGEEPPENKMGE